VREAHRDMLVFGEDPARLLEHLGSYVAPAQEKWLERFQL